MNTITDTIAADINHHHELACAKADEAVSHAVQAGKLLLEVKASMQHGQFGPWLASNIAVTPRQAQRYMAAAQGKPTPIRAPANATSASLCRGTKLEPRAGALATHSGSSVPEDFQRWFGEPAFFPTPGHWYCTTTEAGGYRPTSARDRLPRVPAGLPRSAGLPVRAAGQCAP